MLVTLQEITRLAAEKSNAVGAFNTPNLEELFAVLEAAEELQVPVILSHAQLHEPVAPLSKIGPIMVLAAKAAKVPVCVHLDHCEELDYLQKALELGFTGVMYDGSALSYEENAANSRKAVAMAHACGAGVEGEIGTLPSREGGEKAAGPVYTEPSLALRFVQETGIDALAPSFGTAHGVYKAKPVLDIPRVRTIAELTGLPLVMHGGSGVSPEDYRAVIQAGIRKINYYTYMARAGAKAVTTMAQEGRELLFQDYAEAARVSMKENVLAAMKVFAGL